MNCSRISWALWLTAALLTPIRAFADASPLPVVMANDNRTPAGHLRNGVLDLRMELRQARWYPEADDGVSEDIYAFGEEGKRPQSSGPLLRTPQGTHMHISLHNLLPVAAKVYGLHSYPGNPDEFIPLGPGETREVQFDAGEPGTYVYWASTTGGAIDDPVRRQGGETMLEGAFVVDAPGETRPDRIFVIETWEVHDLPKEIILVAINGKAWPATEHLTYKTDEPVSWRIINTTRAPHAMHLHGFFFTV